MYNNFKYLSFSVRLWRAQKVLQVICLNICNQLESLLFYFGWRSPEEESDGMRGSNWNSCAATSILGASWLLGSGLVGFRRRMIR